MNKDNSRAIIRDDKIVIEVDIVSLPEVIEASWACGYLTPRWKIMDPYAFAKDLVYALNHEREDGSTPIHLMYDKCILDAIENGTEGIEEHEDQYR